MTNRKSRSTDIARRSALKSVAATGLAVAGGMSFATPARAAPTLSIWTGYPELVPY